jgi:hypothetical protein
VLLGYLVLAAALSIHRGSFSLWSLGLAFAAFCMTIIGVWPRRKQGKPLGSTEVLMGVLFVIALGLTDFPVTYRGTYWFGTVTHIGLIACGIALACVYLPRPHASARLRNAVVLGTAVFALALQCWLPFAAPDPHIDVFTVQQESAANLFAGKNPFTTRVSNPYEGMDLHLTYEVGTRFAYPPSALAGAVVGYALFGDVRFFYVLCNIFFLWVLRRMLRATGTGGELIPLLWLLHPQGLLFIGQSWTEPLIIAGFALTILARLRNNAVLTAVAHGLTISLKQYLVITAPLLLIFERRWKFLALPAANLLTASDGLMDVTVGNAFSGYFDPVSKYEIVTTGKIGNILGIEVFTDSYREPNNKVFDAGDVYLTAPPEYHGGMTDRGDMQSNPIEGYVNGIAGRGWYVFELMGMFIHNSRGIVKGTRA